MDRGTPKTLAVSNGRTCTLNAKSSKPCGGALYLPRDSRFVSWRVKKKTDAFFP